MTTLTIGKKEITLNLTEKQINDEIESMEKSGLTQEKNYRKMCNELQRLSDVFTEEQNQPEVKSMIITVEWNKNRTWGNCPKASATVKTVEGYIYTESERMTGCGYCKESTALAQIFNKTLKGKLWKLQNEALKNGSWNEQSYTSMRDSLSYGIVFSQYSPYFNGGVGVSSYFNIVKALGGKMECTASGDKFDVYTITF